MTNEEQFDIEHEKKQLDKLMNVSRTCSKVSNELGGLMEGLDSYLDGRILDALDDAVEAVEYARMIARS